MVQNIININEKQDRILNIVKAKFGLKNKSEAVALLVQIYEQNFLEPELRPEYIKKLGKIQKEEKFISFNSIDDLKKSIENV